MKFASKSILLVCLASLLWGCSSTELFVVENGKIVPNPNAFFVRKSRFFGSKLNLYEMEVLNETWMRFISPAYSHLLNTPFMLNLAYFRCPGPQIIYVTKSLPMGFLSPPTLEERAQNYLAHMNLTPQDLSQIPTEIGGQKALQLEYVAHTDRTKVFGRHLQNRESDRRLAPNKGRNYRVRHIPNCGSVLLE